MTKTGEIQQTQEEKENPAITELRNRCSNPSKPFWIWDRDLHKDTFNQDPYNCCFNHIIGLPKKNGKDKPMFDYEEEIYNAIFKHKRIWIKKATGLGITEFFLRLIAWLCLRDNTYRDCQMCIVTGPNIDIAIKLIKRLKALFEPHNIIFDSKETVLELNHCEIQAYPSNHLDAYRSLTNPKFILLDEADFFRKDQQQDVRDVSERYIGKSQTYIAMVSTPNAPGGLFESIEQEKPEQSLYHKIVLGYQKGLGKIYTQQDIIQAKRSPSFEREYNLKYLGAIGNVFDPADIDYAIRNEYDIIQYLDDLTNPPRLQAVCGIDPGWGSSSFAITVTNFVDGGVRVIYSNEYHRHDHAQMVEVVWDLIQRYNITKILIDASAVSFIRALKLQLGERADYEQVDKKEREYMRVEPVSFAVEHKQMLYHLKFMIENKYVQIHPKFDKLIVSLRSAYAKDGTLDKEVTSFDDSLDSFRLALRAYRERSI